MRFVVDFDSLLFLSLRIISAVVALVLIYLLWKRRHSEGASYLLLFEVFALIWVMADAFEGVSKLLPNKIFWSQIAYIGITMAPVFYLMFAMVFAQRKHLINPLLFLFLLIIPVITLFLVFTNSFHGLVWKNITLPSGLDQAVFYYGPWFWIFVCYAYLLLTLGILQLFTGLFKFYVYYHTQVFILIFGSLLPIFANILYVFKLLPLEGVDLTPITFIFSGLLIGLSVFWYKLFDVIPLARKQVINNLDDGLLVVDASRRVMDANPVFCKICGLSSDELLGCLVDNVFQLICKNEKLPREKDFKIEIELDNVSDFQYCEVRGFPVYYKKKKIIGQTIILHDISLMKKSLNTLARFNLRLFEEMEEKEILISDLDAYARTVAHDLKSPVAVILGFNELMQINMYDWSIEKILETTRIIDKEGRKICNIIDDLLLFSRIRVEDITLDLVDMEVNFNDALQRFSRMVEKDQIQIDQPKQWPVVLGHSLWLEEVWLNLLTNAVKYGGTPPYIKISCKRINNAYYKFCVQDNGNGLSKDSLDQLFKDYIRLETKKASGHGLGLSIVKRIIEKSGGEVIVTSNNKAGEGCIFSFTLKALN